MSLSVGTLNLKFMQRAAARSAQGAPPPLPKGVDVVEEEAKWVLPPRVRNQVKVEHNAEAGPSSTSSTRVQFVASYLPFVTDIDNESPSAGGVGRRAFGGFGAKVDEAADGENDGSGDEDEGEDEQDDGDDRMEGVIRSVHVKTESKGKSKAKATVTSTAGVKPKSERQDGRTRAQSRTPEPEDLPAPRTFIRPAGFDTPTSSPAARSSKPFTKAAGKAKGKAGQGQTSSPHVSQADKLRATISSMKSVSVSTPTTTPSAAGKKRSLADGAGDDEVKRARVGSLSEPSTPRTPGTPKPNSVAGGLDERERALKAAKKAEKKKRALNRQNGA